MSAPRPPPRSSAAILSRSGFQLLRVGVGAAVRKVRASRLGRVHWKRGLVRLLVCSAAFAGLLTAAGVYYFYFDRNDLPDLGGFTRFEFPTIGYIYDANGRPLKEMASESRQITRYEQIPPIVRDALIAAEDRNLFSHSGIDYSSFARVLGKIRLGDLVLVGRLARMGKRDVANNAAIFPQGGSTITQQLVRGYFLKNMVAQENSDQLRHSGHVPRILASVIGARTVNMLVRKAGPGATDADGGTRAVTIAMKESQQIAAEHGDRAAHAHQAGAERHGKEDHLTGHEISRHALEHSNQAYVRGEQEHERTRTAAGSKGTTHEASEQDIAARAYALWQARGCPGGSPEEDWFQAVEEMRSGR